MFWSQPKPWANTIAWVPVPLTFTLCRCNTDKGDFPD
jgi:hypothetical protein